ncbi:DUF218 domain-containing protein [Pseudooceanicola antarcticus]|uniref:DUF218 domain-containing protein n=1 Tax=Pseudooceanicola antarcticus TaxID=1247613 RepID=A0A285IK55_9RHOB|nr:YdcF family protein [Pseudooceanicola antarcticus]PJE28983.1 YdcF family protein [Pseudooceanicola antarcticus]SNY47371.1 DUF218 domain-containing protein [Pseudooceanicola antarcticus]
MSETAVTAIVLGAAVRPDGTASPQLRRRTLHGAKLYHAGEVSRLALCGGVGRYGASEASVMADILRAEGVPEAALILEERSTDTITNISNALALCPDMKEVVIVTAPYHAPRARLIARHLGLRARSSCPEGGLSGRKLRRAKLRELGGLVKVLIWMVTGYRLT